MHITPIGEQGAVGFLQDQADDQALGTVWSELTGNRQAKRAGHMRAILPQVYVPAEGLMLDARAGTDVELIITWLQSDSQMELSRIQVRAGKPVVVPRKLMKAGEAYQLDLHGAERRESMRWMVVSEDQVSALDGNLKDMAAAGLEEQQRWLSEAVLYERLRLSTNRELVLKHLR
ncbi:hypothetical protein [Paucibacter sp. DJ2R-2]|uniref:hypothetical protein n=1 Tax=Paucibacter sp. DJ2R-2 TaxID=2893558 RepID=UPI0021E3E8EF|nr:hypothetical protein [Paucibacter sp. DJ2R-2]MCV2422784.1 hypothetical protein [Paucibacter sp. DJ4R-1]MCV2441075.1 hypothetical protein [Paucibacter sp. DJ2R-2]